MAMNGSQRRREGMTDAAHSWPDFDRDSRDFWSGENERGNEKMGGRSKALQKLKI